MPRELIGKTDIVFPPEQARHVATVLRLRPGERVVVFDGTGTEYVAELVTVTPAHASARPVETRPGTRPLLHLALLQGVPKGTKMDEVVRMGTELGVAEFIPFLSARTVAEGRGRAARWRRIVSESAAQCRRSDVPVVSDPVPLDEALDRVAGYDLVLVLWEGEQTRSMAQALTAAANPQRVAVIVGPEGGLADAEVERAVTQGAVQVTLGPLILRTETAGVAALAMVVYELALRRPFT